jgi:hypothetical protein
VRRINGIPRCALRRHNHVEIKRERRAVDVGLSTLLVLRRVKPIAAPGQRGRTRGFIPSQLLLGLYRPAAQQTWNAADCCPVSIP